MLDAYLEDIRAPVMMVAVAVVLAGAVQTNTVLMSLVEMSIVDNPVVGLANVLEWSLVADPNPDTVD